MTDLAIIGAGFGGTLLAMIARQLGRSVVLLEKRSHPRFAIGESSTPLADLLWLELADRYGLDRLRPFAKWGTWRRAHPEVACGLKRGFTFYHHPAGQPFVGRTDRADQLLVAASPRDEIADTHWYRPDFDHFLAREAVRLGVDYFDHCEVTGVCFNEEGARLEAIRDGASRVFRARFVVDASNFRGRLAGSLGLVEEPLPHLPGTQALYTHFRGVARLADLPIHADVAAAPFPVDDAAVHHVFEGGWIWVLRFVNGITSAGVAATDSAARRFGLAEGMAGWGRLMEHLPTVARQFAGAEPVHPWVHTPRLAFQIGPAAGDRWALLPSAAGFVDPLLSSGFTLTLLGIERLAGVLGEDWQRREARRERLRNYAADVEAERLALEHYIAALYARMADFAGFVEVARLYFCAVVYGEAARRLGRPEMAGGFLMHRHPGFGPAARECLGAALAGLPAEELRCRVDEAIAPFDVGGLSDPGRRPWYPVLAGDLRAAGGRLGASMAEVEEMLRRAGF